MLALNPVLYYQNKPSLMHNITLIGSHFECDLNFCIKYHKCHVSSGLATIAGRYVEEDFSAITTNHKHIFGQILSKKSLSSMRTYFRSVFFSWPKSHMRYLHWPFIHPHKRRRDTLWLWYLQQQKRHASIVHRAGSVFSFVMRLLCGSDKVLSGCDVRQCEANMDDRWMLGRVWEVSVGTWRLNFHWVCVLCVWRESCGNWAGCHRVDICP